MEIDLKSVINEAKDIPKKSVIFKSIPADLMNDFAHLCRKNKLKQNRVITAFISHFNNAYKGELKEA